MDHEKSNDSIAIDDLFASITKQVASTSASFECPEFLPLFRSMTERRTLIQWDGPLVTEFSDANGHPWIAIWVDIINTYNRWIVFPVTRNALDHYLNGRVTLLTILLTSLVVVTLDIDDNAEAQHAVVSSPRLLPAEYLPGVESFYPRNE